MVMTFDYYYGAQAEQFNFIRIPKAMIVDPMFADLPVNEEQMVRFRKQSVHIIKLQNNGDLLVKRQL